MILADTSIWIDHLRRGNRHLITLLEAGGVLTHPFVIGEVALGNLGQRKTTLQMLHRLPQAPVATPDEVLHLIAQQRLFGAGIGYVDISLLASARLGGNVPLWTRDKRLRAVAETMSLTRNLPE